MGAILIAVPFWSYRQLLYAESITLLNHEQSLKSSIQHSQIWSSTDKGPLVGLIFCIFCLALPSAGLVNFGMYLIRFTFSNSEQGLNIANVVSEFPATWLTATLAVNSPILSVSAIFISLGPSLNQITEWRWLVVSLSDVFFISALTIVILAFWQSTKAALHYKAASKQEGLDLQFQER